MLVPQRAADRPAGRAVPEPRGPVVAPGEDRPAVGAEGHGRDPVARGPAAGRSGRPVAASQSRAVLSQLPVRTVRPSGLNATEVISVLVAHRPADRPAGRDVPEPGRLVDAPGQHGAAVGAERHAEDRIRRGGTRARPSRRSRRPRAGRRSRRSPVRRVRPSGLKATAPTFAGCTKRLADGLARGGLPEPDRAVVAGDRDGAAVGAVGHGMDRAGMLAADPRAGGAAAATPRGSAGRRARGRRRRRGRRSSGRGPARACPGRHRPARRGPGRARRPGGPPADRPAAAATGPPGAPRRSAMAARYW